MPFSFDSWKRALAGDDWKSKVRGLVTLAQSGAVKSTYAACIVAALAPATVAVLQGDPAAMSVLTALLGSVGADLIAGWFPSWKGKKDAEIADEMADLLAKNQELRTQLDILVRELGVLTQAYHALSEDHRSWFQDTLRSELDRLGSSDLYINFLGDVSTGGAPAVQVRAQRVVISGDRPTVAISEPVARFESQKSREDAELTVKKWLKRNPWVRRDVVRQVISTSRLMHLRHWPIILQFGTGIVDYQVTEHERVTDRRNSGSAMQRTRKIVNKRSRPLPVAWPVFVNFSGISESEEVLVESVIAAATGYAARVKYDWLPFDLLARFFKNPQGKLKHAGKYLWRELATAGGPSTPIWPDLALGSQRLGIKRAQSGTAMEERDSGWGTDERRQATEKAFQQIHSRIAKTKGPEPDSAKIELLDLRLVPVLYPFWLLRGKVDQKDITVVLSGTSGHVVYAELPTGLAAKLAIVFLTLAVIALIAILIAVLLG